MSQFGPDDPFATTKRPSISFHQKPVGTVISGRVIEDPKEAQQRDFETGQPATWDDGNPKMAVVVALEVDGEERSLWAPKPSAMFEALRQAQIDANARISVGGTLHVKFTGEEPNKERPHLNPQKLYAAKYEPADAFASATAVPPPAPQVANGQQFGPDEAPF